MRFDQNHNVFSFIEVIQAELTKLFTIFILLAKDLPVHWVCISCHTDVFVVCFCICFYESCADTQIVTFIAVLLIPTLLLSPSSAWRYHCLPEQHLSSHFMIVNCQSVTHQHFVTFLHFTILSSSLDLILVYSDR